MLSFVQKILLVSALSISASAWAASYQLNTEQSSIYFSSVKNDTLIEEHTFKDISGEMDNKGNAVLSIDLSSVDTHIDIRDERMRDLFFQVKDYPQATATVAVDKMLRKQLKPGFNEVKTLPVTLDFRGKQKTYQQALRISVLKDKSIQVTTVKPLYISVADYSLNAGLKQLLDLAKLNTILPVVPVSVDLTYQVAK